MNYELYHAAMYAALGSKCQVSSQGYAIIFSPEYRLSGRADLSGLKFQADEQMKIAGLDPDSVTKEQLEAYRGWEEETRLRHAHDTAYFMITNPTGSQLRHRKANLVELRASGSVVDCYAVRCIDQYDPEGINTLGRKGAYKLQPDSEKIRKALEKLKREHPEFANAEIKNNAGAEL